VFPRHVDLFLNFNLPLAAGFSHSPLAILPAACFSWRLRRPRNRLCADLAS
jgi:hypothetical protein